MGPRLCPDLVRVAGRHDPDALRHGRAAARPPVHLPRLLALVRPEGRPVRRVRTKLPLLPGGDVWHAGVDRLLRDGVRGFNGRRRFLTREVCTERIEGSELWRWIEL